MAVRTAAEVGQFVRYQRKSQGFTQADLATKAGVSRDWLVRLEQGHHRLELGLAMRVVSTLGYGFTPTKVEPATDNLLETILANTKRSD